MSDLIKYKLLVDTYETSIGLYENIENLAEILDLTENDNFCLINAEMIFDINQILCAINKSIYTKLNNKLITKRLNTEILFSLYPGKNITESLKTFGVNRTANSLPIFALVVNQTDDENQSNNCQVFDQIKGKLLPIESLKDLRNESQIDEIYKLKSCQNESSKWDLIISRIATKDLI